MQYTVAQILGTHLRSIGRIFNGGLLPLTMGRLAQRRQAEPLFSFLKKSRALCRMSVRQPALCICICICICSVQSVRLGGELRWRAMYVPPPPEFETQHTESHSWAQKWADPTPQLPLRLSPPISRFIASIFHAKIISLRHFGSMMKILNCKFLQFMLFCMLMLLSILDIGDIPFIGCCIAVGLGWYQVATRGEALYSTKHKSLYSTKHKAMYSTKHKSLNSTTEYSSTTECNRVMV